MIKINLKKAIESSSALQILLSTDNINSQTSYNIAKVVRCIKGPIDSYNTIMTKRVNELVNKDESGKPIMKNDGTPDINEPIKTDLVNELNKILENEKIEIGVEKIPLSEFSKATIKPIVFLILDWLISE